VSDRAESDFDILLKKEKERLQAEASELASGNSNLEKNKFDSYSNFFLSSLSSGDETDREEGKSGAGGFEGAPRPTSTGVRGGSRLKIMRPTDNVYMEIHINEPLFILLDDPAIEGKR